MARTKLPDLSIEEWKWRIIGWSERIVCKLDDEKVVKFGCPMDKWTGLQNKIEAKTWKKIQGTGAEAFFAATLYGAKDGSYNIQEMADGDVEWYDGSVVLTSPEYVKSEDRTMLSDMGDHQIGYHYATGKPVVRDYGVNQQHWGADDGGFCGECIYCQLKEAGAFRKR